MQESTGPTLDCRSPLRIYVGPVSPKRGRLRWSGDTDGPTLSEISAVWQATSDRLFLSGLTRNCWGRLRRWGGHRAGQASRGLGDGSRASSPPRFSASKRSPRHPADLPVGHPRRPPPISAPPRPPRHVHGRTDRRPDRHPRRPTRPQLTPTDRPTPAPPRARPNTHITPVDARSGLIWMSVCQGAASILPAGGAGLGVGWRGRFPGRARAEGPACSTCLVRLICEGWLPQDPCSSPGSQSRSGRGPAVLGCP